MIGISSQKKKETKKTCFLLFEREKEKQREEKALPKDAPIADISWLNAFVPPHRVPSWSRAKPPPPPEEGAEGG